MQIFRSICATSAVALAFSTMPAIAQDQSAPSGADQAAAAPGLDIVVTGSRLRSESVQKAPVAVSVVSSAMIENRNAADISNLSAAVPNLLADIVGVSPGLAVLSIRGFVTRTTDVATEPGVAVYVDGIYQTILTGSLVDTFDIESIEVLRGPQGALLGKSAGAGAIMINRTKPKMEFGGRAEVEYGSHNLIRVAGLVNIPVIQDTLAVKLFATARHRGDIVKNLEIPGADLGEQQSAIIRGAVLFTPSSDFSLYLTADYMKDTSKQAGGRNISPDAPANPTSVADYATLDCAFFAVCGPHKGRRNVTNATELGKPRQKQTNVTARAEWSLGGAKITSLSGYRHYFNSNTEDLDQSAQPILHVVDSVTRLRQYSEELRLSSEDAGGLDFDGRLQWIIGAYIGHSNAYMDQPLVAFGADSSQAQRVIRNNVAVFAHADYKPFDFLTLNFGVRRSKDRVRHRFNFSSPGLDVKPFDQSQKTSFHNTSFEGGAQFQATDDIMVYYRYAEGYRSGGFVGFPGSAEAAAMPFRPETSSSHEIGLKSRLLDGLLTYNLTLFRTKFQDMQRDVVTQGPNGGFVQVTANAAAAVTKGIEMEAALHPAQGLTISGNAGYLKARYSSFISFDQVTGQPIDLSNNPITYAPKWTASGAIDYEHELGQDFIGFDTIDFNANVDYRSSFVFDPVTKSLASPGYAIVNSSLGFEGGDAARYKLTFYVNNLLKKRYSTLRSNISNLLWFAHDDPGRTVGVKLGVQF